MKMKPWSSDPEIATVEMGADGSLIITALKTGQVTIHLPGSHAGPVVPQWGMVETAWYVPIVPQQSLEYRWSQLPATSVAHLIGTEVDSPAISQDMGVGIGYVVKHRTGNIINRVDLQEVSVGYQMPNPLILIPEERTDG
jgi:hypothetical protein